MKISSRKWFQPRHAAWLGGALVFTLIATHAAWSPYYLFYNRTESVPVGVYLGRAQDAPPSRGDLVRTPYQHPGTEWAETIGPPDGYWLVKEVRAVPGDRVQVDADGVVKRCDQQGCTTIAKRHPQVVEDHGIEDLDLPRKVPQGHYFLATDHESGFDSRYFGLVNLGTADAATPLWVKDIP